jgi:hypothetical protein
MVKVEYADLRGKLAAVGPVTFLRVEWWLQAPRFVLLKFSIEGEEQKQGIRMDIDKHAILDSVGNDSLDKELQNNAQKIWQVVAQEKAAKLLEVPA